MKILLKNVFVWSFVPVWFTFVAISGASLMIAVAIDKAMMYVVE